MRPLQRGDVWWVEFPTPRGSEPGFRHPGVVIQANEFNRSRLATTVVALVSSNLALADAPGNVFLARPAGGLRKDSVVNVTQVLTVDRGDLVSRIGKLPERAMAAIDDGVRLVLGLAL